MYALKLSFSAFGSGQFEVTNGMRIKERIGTTVLDFSLSPVSWIQYPDLRIIIASLLWGGVLYSAGLWLLKIKPKSEQVGR